MRFRTFAGETALLLTALIWGFAFSAQKSGAESLAPLVFVTLRLFIGATFLVPVIALADRIAGRRPSLWGGAETPEARRRLVTGGLVCGAALAGASALQQSGIADVASGKAGFLTSLYMILVPVFGLVVGRKTRRLLWAASALALGGMWLLTAPAAGWKIGTGDLLILGCAAAYACHILAVDRFAAAADCLRLSCLQFFFGGVLALLAALLAGAPWERAGLERGLAALLFCGIGSNGIAFTLQVVGQKYLHPVTASLIMSLEAVFSVLGGWLCFGEVLSGREMAGCAVIFAAVLLVQLPAGRNRGEG